VHHRGDDDLLRAIRDAWPSVLLVVRKNRSRDRIAADIETGLADMAPLGRFALANPDVVERLQADAPFNEIDKATIYGGTAVGYTDYPTLTRV
jgi:2,4-dienoyl-CoA reductase-like NADH-dependent reductase (Old Yellow Enzyme family)